MGNDDVGDEVSRLVAVREAKLEGLDERAIGVNAIALPQLSRVSKLPPKARAEDAHLANQPLNLVYCPTLLGVELILYQLGVEMACGRI